jgi:hypothetical protein
MTGYYSSQATQRSNRIEGYSRTLRCAANSRARGIKDPVVTSLALQEDHLYALRQEAGAYERLERFWLAKNAES